MLMAEKSHAHPNKKPWRSRGRFECIQKDTTGLVREVLVQGAVVEVFVGSPDPVRIADVPGVEDRQGVLEPKEFVGEVVALGLDEGADFGNQHGLLKVSERVREQGEFEPFADIGCLPQVDQAGSGAVDRSRPAAVGIAV